MMQQARWVPMLLGLWILSACVTINIYFPAAAAERAADRIIEDVWGTQQAPAEQPGEAAPPAPNSGRGIAEQVAVAVLDFVLPVAQAQEANLNISTPEINRLRVTMKVRHAKLEPHYDSGVIGLTRDGLIAVRDIRAVGLRDRARISSMVADENADRNALYQELARANGHPEWTDQIRETFAQRWVLNARPGWWYQDAKGDWRQK